MAVLFPLSNATKMLNTGGEGAGRKTLVRGSQVYFARKHFLHISEIFTSLRKIFGEFFTYTGILY